MLHEALVPYAINWWFAKQDNMHIYQKGAGWISMAKYNWKTAFTAVLRNQLAETVAPTLSTGAATTPPISSETPSPPSSRDCSKT